MDLLQKVLCGLAAAYTLWLAYTFFTGRPVSLNDVIQLVILLGALASWLWQDKHTLPGQKKFDEQGLKILEKSGRVTLVFIALLIIVLYLLVNFTAFAVSASLVLQLLLIALIGGLTVSREYYSRKTGST